MALQVGTRLGPYEITAPIGAGGMGEVYKARDTRLERVVAIKILPETLASDSQFRDRLDREARAISQLDHPNICTLYDVGEQNGTAYLVMQFLEGETLEARLKKGALPLDQALSIAIQMASALEKAHRAGITHRDLKPGNIMLTKAGAKLLDFGLAKTSPGVATGGLSMLPTTPPAAITAQGTILGTFQYMAPEQLEGQEADARTDIFAFGTVAYEMITGRKAFVGKSQASLITAIMSSQPATMASLQPLTPASLDHIVTQCLAKDPDDRWQSAGDLTRELQWLTNSGSHAGPPRAPTLVASASSSRVGWIAAAIFFLTTLAAVAAWYLGRSSADTHVYRSAILTPTSLIGPVFGRVALSPDGRRLAYTAPDAAGRIMLWIRPLDSTIAQPLASTEGASAPFWSADSHFVAFIANGKLKKIDASGGPALTLCDAAAPLPGTWNRDDVIVFPSGTGRGSAGGSPLFRVPAAGGVPVPATSVDTKAGETTHVSPFFLPDGRHFLFTAQGSAAASGVYVASLDSPDRKRLLNLNTSVRYAQGYVLFLQEGTLMARPFDAGRLAFTGDAVPVAEQINGPRAGAASGVFAVSQSGVLVYQEAGTSGAAARLTWVDRTGKVIANVGEPGAFGDVELSPDGQRAVVTIVDPSQGQSDLWTIDLSRGLPTRLTFDPRNDVSPLWSPDGSRIVFGSDRRERGRYDLYVKAANGTGAEQPLLATEASNLPQSWSSDSQFVAYGTRSAAQFELWVLPLAGERKPMPVLQTPFANTNMRFSPDGRWIAYQSNESGRAEVYVTPFPGPGGKWQVSAAGGVYPRWRRDGKEIFFYNFADQILMAATVNVQENGFQVGRVSSLFQAFPGGPRYFYDVSSDGQRFLLNTTPPQNATAVEPLTLVVNWAAALKK
jgi:serine/threonine protein kinase/Tol biopolymer transport system component